MKDRLVGEELGWALLALVLFALASSGNGALVGPERKTRETDSASDARYEIDSASRFASFEGAFEVESVLDLSSASRRSGRPRGGSARPVLSKSSQIKQFRSLSERLLVERSRLAGYFYRHFSTSRTRSISLFLVLKKLLD